MSRYSLSLLAACLCFATSTAMAQGAGKPTDPQIAHIAYTAGQLDIKAAELAKRNSKNKDVLSFADDMIRDHKAVNEQALALVKKLNVTPEENETSRTLTKQAEDQLQKLSSLQGAEFDRAYAQNEVAYHQLVNESLRKTLIPSANNPELKTLLSTGLKIFEGHQQHADKLAQGLK